MMVKKYFNEIFGDSLTSFFVAKLDTNEIVYYNKSFEDLLKIKQDLIGVPFDKIVASEKIKHMHNFTQNWNQEEIYKSNFFIDDNKTHIEVSNTKIEYMGEFYNLCKINLKHNKNAEGLSFEDAMTRCISIFQQPNDTVLESLLELLGTFYKSNRAYIYRFNPNTSTVVSVIKWDLDPENITSNELSEVNEEFDISNWLIWANRHQDLGVIHVNSSAQNFDWNATEAQLLKAFNIRRNCSLGFIENESQQIVGVVGFNESQNENFDFRFLRAMIQFVAQNFNKQALDETLSVIYNDTLTGFYSREVYSEKIEEISNNNPKSLGVISINVNGLKQVNDNLGYAYGDELIQNSAIEIKEHFGYDFYRLSGDEFVGIATNVDKKEFEDKIIQLHEKMRSEDNFNFALGHSWVTGRCDFAKALHEAETLMYINKQEYYHVKQHSFKNVNNRILSDLLSYIANDEFMIYLQPQVRLKDASLYGAEALIRRFDKTNQKMVFPDQFISMYEQHSVIRHVDIFVVESVCKILNEWEKVGKAIPISVNLSRVTLQEYGIVDTIIEICDRHQVPHEFLVIEVTERVGLIENNVASSLIVDFKKNGFNISLDDFGCAYSNIVTLAQIEVDEVKIDKSLVDDLTSNRKNNILVKNVLSMCKELDNTSTLAEGIEDENQARLLYELGCHLGQGYFYSRPIPVDEFIERYIK